MVKRNEKFKHITVSPGTYDRFLAFRQYGENAEGILIKIMDLADKGKKFSTNHRNKEDTNG